jgi:hypothetical protein
LTQGGFFVAQLKILTKIEVDKVVSPPVYTQEEKKIYFSLTEDVSKLTSAMRSVLVQKYEDLNFTHEICQ